MNYVTAQLCGGGLMLGALFMATDYVTSPITPRGQIIFGICCGIFTGLFRCFGAKDVYKRQFSMGTSQPATEVMVEAFKGTEFDTGLDQNLLAEIADYFRPCLLYTSERGNR